MSADLAEWLTQIWVEEERLAIKAGGDRWILDGGIHRESHPTDEVVDWVYDEADEHIAYHDPASVLARIAADRQILALHSGSAGLCSWSQDGNDTHDPADPCQTARLLALRHADRADYRGEWKPS